MKKSYESYVYNLKLSIKDIMSVYDDLMYGDPDPDIEFQFFTEYIEWNKSKDIDTQKH